MTKKQEAELRVSEIRERLSVINALPTEERTDVIKAERDKLIGTYAEAEKEYRSAVIAEKDDPTIVTLSDLDAETRERIELRSKASIGRYLGATLHGTLLDGAEAELSAAFKVGGNMPLAMLAHEPKPLTPEQRAVTPGVNAATVTEPTADFVFERSAAASLGFMFPSAADGVQNIPVLTTAPPAGVVDKGDAVSSTAAAFRLDALSPKRIGGQFECRIEDKAVFPSMDTDLRRAIQDSCLNALDEAVFSNSDGSAGTLHGLLNQATDVAIAGDKETFVSGVTRLAAFVDGQYSYGLDDVRAVVGSATYAAYMALWNNTLKGDIALFDYLKDRMGSFRVSNRVPAVAATGQKGIVTLTAPMYPMQVFAWAGVSLIVDPYSKAGNGITVVTATMLVSDPHLPYGTSTLKEIHPKLS